MSITFGWWIIPTLVTIAVWSRAYVDTDRETSEQRSDYDFGGAFAVMLYGGLALIITFASWLIYFIALQVFT